jgi:hypothetical protein
MRSKQPEIQPERIMGELCLAVAINGREILLQLGLCSAGSEIPMPPMPA